jgi:hypothetical protein
MASRPTPKISGTPSLTVLKWHTSDFGPLIRCCHAAENPAKQQPGPTVRENFGRKMQDVHLLLLIKYFKGISKDEAMNLRLDLEDHNTTTIEEGTGMAVKCAKCGEEIHGEARNTKEGFVHLICPDPKSKSTTNPEEENIMAGKTTTNKDAKKADKKPAEKKTTEKKTTEPVAKTDGVFRDGSKYAFVYAQLRKGITMEKLVKVCTEKYDENMAKTSNIRVYVKTIAEKVEVKTDDKGVMTATAHKDAVTKEIKKAEPKKEDKKTNDKKDEKKEDKK